jgi:hypothetical protein
MQSQDQTTSLQTNPADMLGEAGADAALSSRGYLLSIEWRIATGTATSIHHSQNVTP